MNADERGCAAFGERAARIYDTHLVDPRTGIEAADRLGQIAPGLNVLEIGIGTGRIGLPLARAGFMVTGVEPSPAMLARLVDKGPPEDLTMIQSDFLNADLAGPFDLIFAAHNTIYFFSDRTSQLRCFERMSALLAPDGIIVIEAFIPDLGRFDRGQRVETCRVEPDYVLLQATRHDDASQCLHCAQLLLTEERTDIVPMELRYAWPSELDLMARMADLELRDRWCNWQMDLLTDGSARHVSTYSRRATAL
jgi:SAM-dependent methyltransferase